MSDQNQNENMSDYLQNLNGANDLNNQLNSKLEKFKEYNNIMKKINKLTKEKTTLENKLIKVNNELVELLNKIN